MSYEETQDIQENKEYNKFRNSQKTWTHKKTHTLFICMSCQSFLIVQNVRNFPALCTIKKHIDNKYTYIVFVCCYRLSCFSSYYILYIILIIVCNIYYITVYYISYIISPG